MFSPQVDEGLIFAESLLGCLEENSPKRFDASNALLIPYALRSVMRHLLCEGSACSAKKELEDIIDAQCKFYWQLHMSRSCDFEMAEQHCKLQFLHSLSGFKSESYTKYMGDGVCEIPPALPCRLLYVLYYVTCAQCGPSVVYKDIQSPWAYLFFGAMIGDLPLLEDWVPPQSNEELLRELRRGIVFLFSSNTFPECGTFVLSFLDTCRSWILGDYQSVLEHSKPLLLHNQNPRNIRNISLLELGFLKIMYEVLLFMHIIAVVLTMNMGQHASRCEVQTIIQQLFVRPHISEGITVFMNRVFLLIHQELVSEDDTYDDTFNIEKKTKLDKVFCLLRVWLRAKRLTDSGQMESSRDLLLRALTKMRDDEEVILLPVQWLRKLFFINCAALSDTSTLLCVLRDWECYEMRLSEVLYIATCPTLGAGGLHSSLFGCMCREDSTRDFVRAVQGFRFCVQIPLLAQRLWGVRRRALHCNVEDRIALENEMLFLCDAIVPLARGLAGTLELSFTDCAPHRLLFDAITIACDIQEDVLRDAAAFPQDDTCALQCTHGSRKDTKVSYDVVNPNGDTDSTASDAWLKVQRTPLNEREVSSLSKMSSLQCSSSSLLSLSSSSSSSSSSDSSAHSTTTNVSCMPSQSVYWRAQRRTMRWLTFLENSYAHLNLTVKICQLRMAAASFDHSAAQLTRELFDSFGSNALAITHGARALFASLNIVAAEKHICKALQIYPHSAEVQRLYCFMCSSHNAVDLLETKKEWSFAYKERYRGLLPLRYTLQLGSTTKVTKKTVNVPMSHVIPVVLSILCVIFLAASLILHFTNASLPIWRTVYNDSHSESGNFSDIASSSMTDEVIAFKGGVYFNWSFVLPFSGHLYFGLFIVVYAITATAFSCYNNASTDDRFAAVLYFLKLSMMHGNFVDDLLNRLVFTLRGVGLVNVVTVIQIVVKNTLLLDAFNRENCYISEAKDNINNKSSNSANYGLDGKVCRYALMEWTVACVLLTFSFTVFCFAFHNRACRVLRSYDIITGSVATYITLFILDATFLLVLFPALFICCAVLEPILFMMSLIFALLSSPLFVEHIASVPTDAVLSTVGPGGPTAFGAAGGGGVDMALFAAEAARRIRSRLSRALPPRHWSPGRRHDYPIYCLHELDTVPSDKQCSKVISVASYIIHLYLLLHRAICWRTHRSPLCSAAAVQLALLREAYAAVLPRHCFSSTRSMESSSITSSSSGTFGNEAVRGEAEEETMHCGDTQRSLFGTSPFLKSQGATAYG